MRRLIGARGDVMLDNLVKVSVDPSHHQWRSFSEQYECYLERYTFDA
jgi:hypothetical protein